MPPTLFAICRYRELPPVATGGSFRHSRPGEDYGTVGSHDTAREQGSYIENPNLE